MTLDRLYELVIYKLIYGYIRFISVESTALHSYQYYGNFISHSTSLIELEYWPDSYTLRASETNILITKYENSHEC